jgi:dipeptidyl aminopeptidase/acylaminoacyl peptidase
MTAFDRFERAIPELMTELAPTHVPDYFDDLLQETATTRQRPAWSSLERWLPMDVALPRPSSRSRSFAGLAALLIVGLLLGAIALAYVGSRAQAVPAPFGPAANGALYFSSADGDIFRVDTVDGTPRAIVTGPAHDSGPLPSRDGQRIVFTRDVTGGSQVVLADAQGANARALPGIYAEFSELDWSPSGDQIAVVSTVAGIPSISIIQTDGSGAKVLPLGLETHEFWYLPSGQIVFKGTAAGSVGLYVVHGDGTGLRPIAPPAADDSHWLGIAPSPDGTSLVYHRWVPPDEPGRLYTMDIATGIETPIVVAETDPVENFEGAQFAPDGRSILFARYAQTGTWAAVVPVTGGPAVKIGETVQGNDEPVANYSPDGRYVIAYYPDNSHIWLLDPTGATPGRQLDLPALDAPIFQRVAP